jgi:cell division protein FtsL
MNVDVEYAIKKDIKNNPVLREVDTRERREFRRLVLLAALSVAMVLFSAWQHFRIVRGGYAIQRLQIDRANEETINRQLQLNLRTLAAPSVIDERARTELGLEPATPADTVMVERVHKTEDSGAVMAEAR